MCSLFPLELLRCRLTDRPGANDEHGRVIVCPIRDQLIQCADLPRRAGDDEHAVGANLGVRERGLQLSSLPEADHADAGLLPQSGIAHRLTEKRRVACRQLRDLQLAELSDHVRLPAARHPLYRRGTRRAGA